ncbi:MAG: hypothetical protein ABR607_16225 [Pyrinomonadaceae bacterium]
MKTIRHTLILVATLTVLCFSALTVIVTAQTTQTTQEQNQATAIMRGYRTGYSDGYQAGVGDAAKNAGREFRNKAEYDRADRAFNSAWGSLEEYRDGYRQGFELGYNAAYDHKPFDSTIPTDLTRRTEDSTVQYPIDPNKTTGNTAPDNSFVLPRDTVMRVELMNSLSTDASQKGDRFQARVLEPNQFQGAVLEGHLEQVKRPGKAKGNAQLQLSFDQIKMPNGRSSPISAQVIEVIPNGGSQGVGKVDSEGGVQGQGSTKGDVQKVGTAAGIGAVIGLIAGGGAGAAIGASIGAGVGTAGVLTQRGKDIRLDQGQQLRIRTAVDAEVQ